MKKMYGSLFMTVILLAALRVSSSAEDRSSENTFIGARPQGLGGAAGLCGADDECGAGGCKGGVGGVAWGRCIGALILLCVHVSQ